MTTVINAFDDDMNAVEGHAMRQIIPHFNPTLVAASIAVSLIGAFTSTQLICCARSARTLLGVFVWTILSGFVFGFCAVFCIHEIAMLACELDVPIGIDPTWTIISATLATVFTFAALAGGSFREFHKDNETKMSRRQHEVDTRGYAMSDILPPGHIVSATVNDRDIHDGGNDNNAYPETDDTFWETQSDVGLLDAEHGQSPPQKTVFRVESSVSQKPNQSFIAAFTKHHMPSLLKIERRSVELDNQDPFESQDDRTPKPLAALAISPSGSPSGVSASMIASGLGLLPRSKEASESQSSNVFVATATVVYAGLTFENIVKGLLWSASLTSMHYCGLLSLKIPNGVVVFNPTLVVVAATICWNVCIVGAICMETMTDMLAQQLLFSFVATTGCAGLHWSGEYAGNKL